MSGEIVNNEPAKTSYLAVVVSGLLAFGLSLVWYSPWLFGGVWQRFRDTSVASAPKWKFFIAPLREIITAAVLSFLIVRIKPENWKEGLLLGSVLWFGFYVVQLAGAVIWDNRPWQLSAVHGGDWLIKLLFMTTALSVYYIKRGW